MEIEMRSFAVLIAVPLMATAALAQTSSTKTPSGGAEQSGQSAAGPQALQQHQQTLQQQVKKNLQQAGFTDIKMMPSSFLVRAKDKQGNPVMMVINPDSVTALTEIPGNPGDDNATTGQGSSPNQSDEGQSPGQAPSGKE
jgi:hypothetical protein